MNCKTCKHWAPSTNDYHVGDHYCEPTDPDTLEPMKMPFEVRKCVHPEQTFCERPPTADGFGVCDGSTYAAALLTGESFGCVKHEPRLDV